MAHVISARLARVARRINARLAISFLYAAWHGWQGRHVRPGVWNFRDPRFDTFAVGGQPHCGKPEASMLLAARVQRALDDGKAVTILTYPRLQNGQARHLSGTGRARGYQAGQRADIGTTRIRTTCGRAINSGES